jgi:hypothetical protein
MSNDTKPTIGLDLRAVEAAAKYAGRLAKVERPVPSVDTRAIRERADKATAGPWTASEWHGEDDGGWCAVGPHHRYETDDEGDWPDSPSHEKAKMDSAFVAAARTDVPLLCDALDASLLAVAARDGEIARLRGVLDEIAKHPYCSYENEQPASSDMDRQYQLGVADGHRCAANVAASALVDVASKGTDQ